MLSGVCAGTVFGLIECDVCVPEALHARFTQMQPVFKNIRLTLDDLGLFMRQYAEKHHIMTTPRRMFTASYRSDKILIATPLLQWYLDHGLEVTHVYQVIEYDTIPCFRRFGDAVSTDRREGDFHPHKAIIVDTMKLLGNSGYGKTITNVDRHCEVKYCTEKAASVIINNTWFRQLDVVVDDAYEIEMNKKTVTYARTRWILRSAIRQDAVLLRLYQQIHGTPSVPVLRDGHRQCLFGGESVDDIVTPELREHFFRHRSEWLPSEYCDEHQNEYVRCRLARRPWFGEEACCKAREAYDKMTPCVFKVEWSGDGFVGLCSKTYYCFGATDKYSTKGLSKRHNNIDKDAFLEVPTNRRSGSGKNRGFRVRHSTVLTYVQELAALTYFYAKRVVREEGVTTVPMDV